MLMRMMMERGKEKEREGGRRREFNHHFVVPRVGVMDEGEGELAPPEPRLSLALSLEQMDMAFTRASGCRSVLLMWMDSQALKI